MSTPAQDIAVHGKGLIAAGTTAAGLTVAWVEQANVYMDFVATGVAIIAGSLTIAWYITRFWKLYRGDKQHEDHSGE